jgi:Tol biopolymer transport system component
MMDLVDGSRTLIVDEPMPESYNSGRATWSHDGRRIVFTTSGSEWPRNQLMAIDVRDGQPTFTRLGDGSQPTLAPDDRRIAFTLFPSLEGGLAGGVWMMEADGSDRHRVGEFGAPFWSPDGLGFLINSFSVPTTSTVVNLQTRDGGAVQVAGHSILSWPSWAGPETLLSSLSSDNEAGSIALLDVRNPSAAKILEVLWKRSSELDVTPRWAVLRPGTRQCIFVGVEAKRRALYSVERGGSGRARPLEVVEYQGQFAQQLGGLAFSPDGRYLLFDANRPERQ